MANKLTAQGRCPTCNEKIAKVDKVDPQRMFYKIKSLLIDQVNGGVVATCSNCKTEVEMPVVKMPRKLKKKTNAKN